MLHWTQMADGHLGPVSNGQRWTFETSYVTWSQKSTPLYTLNPDLIHRSIVTDVLMYRFARFTISLEFAFMVTIFDIFKLIINCKVDHHI